jgi:alpha-1,2-mannosyltransferase
MAYMRVAGERLAVRIRALGQPWELAVFLWIPVLFFSLVVAVDLHYRGSSLGDWEISRSAGLSALHGHSPYSLADPAALAHNDQFVYPPITAALACVPLALRLLGVRDWRCYGLAVLTAPVLDTVSLGALSSVLLLGVAAAWRYRDRRWIAAPVTALTAVAKLFAWPLLVWLLATRRLRTGVVAAAVAAVLLVGGWAAIGFAGLRGYPHLLRVLSRVEETQSYSIAGLLRLHGSASIAVTGVVAGAVVVAVLLVARRPDGDRRALAVAAGGALLAAPVLWLHYLVLLFVPIALARPRLSGLWFLPLAFWLTPLAHSDGSVWRTCFVLAVSALIVGRSLAPALSGGAARRSGLAAPRHVLPAP